MELDPLVNTDNVIEGFCFFCHSWLSMIRIFCEENKGKFAVIAVASHQRDLNNLRLMSYRLNNGVDKVQLMKAKYGGPYLKLKCDQLMDGDGKHDEQKIKHWVEQLKKDYA